VAFLPLRFSAIAALGTGGTLGIEFARAARNARPTRTVEALSSLVRGACFGLGSGLLFGWRFGLSFGAMSTIAQITAYRMGRDAGAQSRHPQTMAHTSARRGQSHDRLRAGGSRFEAGWDRDGCR
jgi:predicted lipid-binding transport protein (Tim44 family)